MNCLFIQLGLRVYFLNLAKSDIDDLEVGDNSSSVAAVGELTIKKHMKKYHSGNLL
jgi:hypothetical protein